MLLQVHDELVFEVPEAEADATAELVKKTMENAAFLSVPLTVEVGAKAPIGTTPIEGRRP